MRVILALRLIRESDARYGIESLNKDSGELRGRLLDMNVDRLYPALKNVTSYLTASVRLQAVRQGVLLGPDGETQERVNCRLYWCEVDTSLPLGYWQDRYEAEVALDKAAFDEFALSIRCCAGAAYIEACEAYARDIPVFDTDPIAYARPTSQEPRRTAGAA